MFLNRFVNNHSQPLFFFLQITILFMNRIGSKLTRSKKCKIRFAIFYAPSLKESSIMQLSFAATNFIIYICKCKCKVVSMDMSFLSSYVSNQAPVG